MSTPPQTSNSSTRKYVGAQPEDLKYNPHGIEKYHANTDHNHVNAAKDNANYRTEKELGLAQFKQLMVFLI